MKKVTLKEDSGSNSDLSKLESEKICTIQTEELLKGEYNS